MEEIMNTPFVPMMLAINSFLEQQETTKQESEFIDLSDKKFASSILVERQDTNKEFEFE